MHIDQALRTLEHLPKRAATPIFKLLKSAIADARHNFQIEEKTLFIKKIFVDEGPSLKRFQPRAFGRAALIRKRTSHVTLILGTRAEVRMAERVGKKSGPVIREVTAEDIQEIADVERKVGRSKAGYKKRMKPADFVRRVFRRKVI